MMSGTTGLFLIAAAPSWHSVCSHGFMNSAVQDKLTPSSFRDIPTAGSHREPQISLGRFSLLEYCFPRLCTKPFLLHTRHV